LNVTIDTSQLTETSGKLAADFVGHVPSSCGDELYQSLATALNNSWSALDAAKQSDPSPALFADFTNRFNSCFAQTMTAAAKNSPSALQQDFAAFQDALSQNISAYRTQLAQKLPGWNISAQYVFGRPVAQPETHDLRLIASGELSGSSSPGAKSVWTLNAAASFYGTLPAGAQYGHFKDAQVSGELDKALGTSSSAPTFSLAGYGQYQQKPSILVLDASSVPSGVTLPADAQGFIQGTQGWLGVVQLKFTFHLGGSQIPIAGKWSNQTNLLDKRKFGGQFGVSYDISNLKQLLGFAAPVQ